MEMGIHEVYTMEIENSTKAGTAKTIRITRENLPFFSAASNNLHQQNMTRMIIIVYDHFL